MTNTTMHELSIAQNLITIAEKAALKVGAIQVESVHMRLGAFSGVWKDALLFAYEIATKGTILEESELIITDVPLIVYCPSCKAEVKLPSIQYFCCPQCNTQTTDIRQGKEIEIEFVEIIDATETT